MALASLLAYQWWAAAWQRRALHRTLEGGSQATIAALPQGELTRITGVVAPREALLTSPLDRQPCIGYSIVDRGDGRAWRTMLKSADCGAFMVTDDSGTAVVEGPVAIADDLDDGAWTDVPRRSSGKIWAATGGPCAHRYTSGWASSRGADGVGNDLFGDRRTFAVRRCCSKREIASAYSAAPRWRSIRPGTLRFAIRRC